MRSAFQKQHFQNIPNADEKRETLFDHIEGRSPGPAWYTATDFIEEKQEHNVFLADGPPSNEKSVGFLGRDPRVPDAIKDANRNSKLPGPGHYQIHQHSLENQVNKVLIS
jgi:hypothetical protein